MFKNNNFDIMFFCLHFLGFNYWKNNTFTQFWCIWKHVCMIVFNIALFKISCKKYSINLYFKKAVLWVFLLQNLQSWEDFTWEIFSLWAIFHDVVSLGRILLRLISFRRVSLVRISLVRISLVRISLVRISFC